MHANNAFLFLVTTLFDIYISIVLARFILQMVRADFYNPVSQFIVKATNPLLLPLRKVVPGFGGLDMASLVLFVLLIMLKLGIVIFLFYGAASAPILQLLILFLKSAANTIINFFLFVIFVSAILSWVVAAGGGYNPFADILNQIAEPVLAPARKIIPPMGGLDISPMLVMIGLVFVKQLFGLSGMP